MPQKTTIVPRSGISADEGLLSGLSGGVARGVSSEVACGKSRGMKYLVYLYVSNRTEYN